MPLIIYQPLEASTEAFVRFWSARCTGYDEKFYQSNVHQELTEARILEWFEWKNGMPLADHKLESVRRNYVARRLELYEIPDDESDAAILARFGAGGAIWRIFWLHCWRPDRFPIYDQHVHRAMVFIESGEIGEISNKDSEKISSYLNHYLPFRRRFQSIDQREADKALWAYGKFIDGNNFPVQPLAQ